MQCNLYTGVTAWFWHYLLHTSPLFICFWVCRHTTTEALTATQIHRTVYMTKDIRRCMYGYIQVTKVSENS